MNKEEIVASMQEIPTETSVKAWVAQVDGKWYQISTFGGRYRIPDTTAIWQCSKRGKRMTDKDIFRINGKDPAKCLGLFIDKLIQEKENENPDELSA